RYSSCLNTLCSLQPLASADITFCRCPAKCRSFMSTLSKLLSRRGARESYMPYAAIPLRLVVGYGFLEHGLAKWFKGADVFAGILHAIGVPLPNLMAWVTIV